MAKKENNKFGRPSKYDPKIHVPWGSSLAKMGATSADIAEAFGVSERTVYRWMTDHEEFRQTITEGKCSADARVVESLFNRAVGKAKRMTVTKKERVGRDGEKMILTEKTEEMLPPDSTAAIWWLKNRQPEMWRDRREVDVSANAGEGIKDWIEALGLD